MVVRPGKTGHILQRGMTNEQGQYALVLHTHNADHGKLIIIQSQGVEKTLELKFDPDDRTTERGGAC